MLRAVAAVFLVVSLVFETAARSELAVGRGFAVAGLAFLILAILVPPRRQRPRPDRRQNVKLYEYVPHPHIEHRKKQGPVKVQDQLSRDNLYKRINAKIAVWVTIGVGSMTCAWLFGILAFAGLPTALKPGNIGLLFWISSDFLQLTLLSVIIVGQNIQALAADKRAESTYKDAEAVLHEALQIQEHLEAQDQHLISQDAILEALSARLVKRLATPGERGEGTRM